MLEEILGFKVFRSQENAFSKSMKNSHENLFFSFNLQTFDPYKWLFFQNLVL